MKKFRKSFIIMACIAFFLWGTSAFASDKANDQDNSELSGDALAEIYDKTEEAKENVETMVENADTMIENAEAAVDNAENIIDNIETITDNAEVVVDKAQELYDEYGDEIPEEPEKAFYEYARDILKKFFHNIIKFIVDFFTRLFS